MESKVVIVFIASCCLAATTAKTLKFHIQDQNQDTIQFSIKNLKDFTWKNCGGDAAGFTYLSVTPDPIQFPGTIELSAKAFFNATVMAPLPTSLLIEKQVGDKYIKLPCIDDFGSCDYDDLCELLEEVDCPQPLVDAGIPCQCPFKVAQYTLPKADFEVDSSFFPSGGYHLKGSISMNGQQAGCLDIYLQVA